MVSEVVSVGARVGVNLITNFAGGGPNPTGNDVFRGIQPNVSSCLVLSTGLPIDLDRHAVKGVGVGENLSRCLCLSTGLPMDLDRHGVKASVYQFN